MRVNMILGGNGIRRKPGLAFAGGVPMPTTLDGSPTLLASWDFDRKDLVTVNAAGNITSLAGADGTPYTLTPNTNGPLAINTNGRVAGQFVTASGHILKIDSACGVDVSLGATHVVVAQIPSAIGDYRVFSQGDSAASDYRNRWYTRFSSASGGWCATKCDADSFHSQVQAAASLSALALIITRYAGGAAASARINVNGNPTEATGTAQDQPTAFNHTAIGGEKRGASWVVNLDGIVMRGAIYSGQLTGTAVEQIAVAMAAGYGPTLNV